MPSRQIVILALLFTMALGVSGCKKRTVHAAPPAAAPAPLAQPVPTTSTPPESKPETPPETPPVPAPAPPPVKPAPAKPHPPDAPKPAPPQISPRLSPEEQAAAERRTNEDINVAERNLQVAYGKQLNASQHDLVEKIRGFLGQAREAMRAADWVRARNLARKAHVLSVELINSL